MNYFYCCYFKNMPNVTNASLFTAMEKNPHNLPSYFFNSNRPLSYSPLTIPTMIKPLMQSSPSDLSYDFRTPTNSPRTNGTSVFNNSSSIHNTPIQQKNNNWLMWDLFQTIGGLGRQNKVPYFKAPDNKDCPREFIIIFVSFVIKTDTEFTHWHQVDTLVLFIVMVSQSRLVVIFVHYCSLLNIIFVRS